MKLYLIFVLLFVNLKFCASKKSAVASAISDLINHHYVNQLDCLQIVKFVDKSKEIDEIANEVLRQTQNAPISIKIINFASRKQFDRVLITESCILLFNDAKSLHEFVNASMILYTRSNAFILLAYVPIRNSFVPYSSYKLDHFYDLHHVGNFLELKTNVSFSANDCWYFDIKVVNKFSMKKMRWIGDETYVNKYRNYNGCVIDVGVDEYDSPPWLVVNISKDNVVTNIWGLHHELMKVASKKLNFTLQYVPFFKKRSDFFLQLRTRGHLKTGYPQTQSYWFEDIIVIIPPGHFYSSYEKLLLPFDSDTWICFIITFAVGFVVIFLLIVAKDSMRDHFFGNRVAAPTLNLLGHFFGIGQKLLPRRNFARIILMIFILFCLIMRTAWQGKYFEFLTSDGRRHGMITIDEINKKKGYFLYGTAETIQITRDVTDLKL